MIELNITAVFQLINFIIALVVLNYLLISPIREVLRQRKNKLSNLESELAAFRSQAQESLAGYEQSLAQVREEAVSKRKAAKAKATSLEQELLAEANAKAQENLKAAKAELVLEMDVAKKSLEAELNIFTKAALHKVLG